MENKKHAHTKIRISVSGAAESGHCAEGAQDQAEEIGREIVRQGAILVNGATTGLPFWAAKGAKDEDGFVVGLSPASSEREHVDLYNLPIDYHDFIMYTGFGYAGRDIIMTRSSDAIIILCGRVGTIHEFTVAFEDKKPIGILEGNGPTDGVIKNLLEKANRPNDKIVFDSDPKALVERVTELVKKDKINHYGVYNNGDHLHDVCDGKNCEIKL